MMKYMISDAARQVGVESHVLRNWEDELELPIERTELGHRYYTEDMIEILKKIKALKEEGLQLRAIKILIPVFLEQRKKDQTQQMIEDTVRRLLKENNELLFQRMEEREKKKGL